MLTSLAAATGPSVNNVLAAKLNTQCLRCGGGPQLGVEAAFAEESEDEGELGAVVDFVLHQVVDHVNQAQVVAPGGVDDAFEVGIGQGGQVGQVGLVHLGQQGLEGGPVRIVERIIFGRKLAQCLGEAVVEFALL